MTQENVNEEISDYSNTLSSPPPSSFVDMIKCTCSNFKYTSVLCCFKLRKQTNVSMLEFKILWLKEKFGVDYLTLVGDNASVEDLKECLRTALQELDSLQGEIEDNLNRINGKELRVNSKMHTKKSAEALERPTVTTDKQQEVYSKKRTRTRRNTTRKIRDDVSSDSFDYNHGYSHDFNGYDAEESTPRCEPKRKSKIGQGRTKQKRRISSVNQRDENE